MNRTITKCQILLALLLVTAGAWIATAADAPDAQPPVEPHPSGNIFLMASNAIVHGSQLRYEPLTNKNCLGYWTKAEDWAEWKFTLKEPRSYSVRLWQGCGKGQGGSEITILLEKSQFHFVVRDTGGYQNFKEFTLGTVELGPGIHSLQIKPENKKSGAIMDVQKVVLIPLEKR
ncbi:MAG: atsA 19 [Verrucomicrobiales bacterium]|nr:atsA 19 [Verrucomicrobiales bacterium]